MLLAQVHHLLYQPNQICVPYLVHTAMNGLKAVVMLIPLKMKLIIFLSCIKSPMLMNLLSTHMGDKKLALISFPNNHEDLELEL